MSIEFSELLIMLQEGNLEEAKGVISSYDEDALVVVATTAYNLYDNNFDAAYELLDSIDSIFNYFPVMNTIDEIKESKFYEPLVEFLKITSYLKHPLGIEISDYFYQLDGDVKSLYTKYDYLMYHIKDYNAEDYKLAKEVIRTYPIDEIGIVFTRPAVFNLIYTLVRNDDNIGFELALMLSNDIYVDQIGMCQGLIVNAKRLGNKDFIVEFVEKVKQVIFEDDSNNNILIYEIYFEILLEKGEEDLLPSLRFLSNSDIMVIKYAELYEKYIEAGEFLESDVELVRVFTKNQIDLENYNSWSNVAFYYLKNKQYREALEFICDQGKKLSSLMGWVRVLARIDEQHMNDYYDYLMALNQSGGPGYSAAITSLKDLLIYSEDTFTKYFAMLDLEKNLDSIDSYLFELGEDRDFYVMKNIVNCIMNTADTSSDVYAMAVSYKLALLVELDNSKDFIQLYNANEEKVGPIIWNINCVSTPKRDIAEFLVTKSGDCLYHVLKKCVKVYMVKNNTTEIDLDFTRKILDKMNELYNEEAHDSKSCYYTYCGIYEYYKGNYDEALELFERSAYNSPDYCYCGGAYLLEFLGKINGTDFENENIESVKKTLEGYKMTGRNTFELSEDLAPGVYFHHYYAYYALKGVEGYDLETALDYLYHECSVDIKTCYYRALVLDRLSYDQFNIDRELNRLREFYGGICYDYEKDYFVILENFNAKIVRPSML